MDKTILEILLGEESGGIANFYIVSVVVVLSNIFMLKVLFLGRPPLQQAYYSVKTSIPVAFTAPAHLIPCCVMGGGLPRRLICALRPRRWESRPHPEQGKAGAGA